MPEFDVIGRRTTTTSMTIDPRKLEPDISSRIDKLEPFITPLLGLRKLTGVGGKPKQHKYYTRQYNLYSGFDYVSAASFGTGNNTAFARLTMDQPEMVTTNALMFYQPQDKLYLIKSGDVVMVVMTPNATIKRNGSDFTCDAALTGNTTTRTAAGTVLVQNIRPYALTSFVNSDAICMGRTIYESQKIEKEGYRWDMIWDCNFVEHKEETLQMDNDMYDWVVTKGTIGEWQEQWDMSLKKFKYDIDSTLWYSDRSLQMNESRTPMRHTMGFFNAVKTNYCLYNPDLVADWESFLGDFIFENGFAYRGSSESKMFIMAPRLAYEFNMAFKEYRRATLDLKGKVGFNIDEYSILGNRNVRIITNEGFRKSTQMEYWGVIIDPATMEYKIARDMETKYYQSNDDREKKYVVEWQGGIAWHTEQVNACLVTA